MYFLVLHQSTRPHVRYGALLDQQTLAEFPTLGLSLFLFVNKYRIQHDDTLPGGVLCDSHLYLTSQVPNKLEIIFGYTDRSAN